LRGEGVTITRAIAELPRRAGLTIPWLAFVATLGCIAFADGERDAAPVKAAPSGPVILSRSTLTPGDSDRNWLTIWQRHGIPQGAGQLVAPDGGIVALERFMLGWTPWDGDGQWHSAFRLPTAVAPKTYTLRVGGVSLGPVTVTPPKGTAFARVWPTVPSDQDDTDRIEDALADHATVELTPGTYRLDRAIRVPNGRTLRGFGAVLTKRPNPADRFDCLFVPADGVTFQGLTFRGNDACFFNDHGGRNVCVLDCRFTDCRMGYWAHGGELLVDRCEFVRASPGIVTGGTFHRCRWEGRDPGFHACHAWRSDRLAIIECSFTDTDRGPGFVANWTDDFNDPFVCCLSVRNVVQGVGGSEVLGFECKPSGGGLNRGLFLHVRAESSGQVNFFAGTVKDCLLRDFTLRGVDILFTAMRRSDEMTGNVVEESELNGGQVVFGPHATNNTVRNTDFVNFTPGRRNVNAQAHHWYSARWAAVLSFAPGVNTHAGCRFGPGVVESATVEQR
jgi:hypothetical protein